MLIFKILTGLMVFCTFIRNGLCIYQFLLKHYPIHVFHPISPCVKSKFIMNKLPTKFIMSKLLYDCCIRNCIKTKKITPFQFQLHKI